MFQLITQFGGYNLYAQIALGLFFLAFMMILYSTLSRPTSQMQDIARTALSDDEVSDGASAVETKAEQGAPHHE